MLTIHNAKTFLSNKSRVRKKKSVCINLRSMILRTQIATYNIIFNRLENSKSFFFYQIHKIFFSIESENYNDNYSILTSKVKGLLTNR